MQPLCDFLVSEMHLCVSCKQHINTTVCSTAHISVCNTDMCLAGARQPSTFWWTQELLHFTFSCLLSAYPHHGVSCQCGPIFCTGPAQLRAKVMFLHSGLWLNRCLLASLAHTRHTHAHAHMIRHVCRRSLGTSRSGPDRTWFCSELKF